MMKNIIVGITAAAVSVAGVLCVCGWFLSEAGATDYYARIDNQKIKKVDSDGGVIDPHGGMP